MTKGSHTPKKMKLMLEAYFAMRLSQMNIKTICDSVGIKNMEN